MTAKREKTRRHRIQCCGSWALVFMGTCNRLPDLNQDVICNQPPPPGGGGGFNNNCYGMWRIGSFILFLGFTRKKGRMDPGRGGGVGGVFLVFEIGNVLKIL